MTRLLVLWLLAERPRYGYEITKSLSDSGMRFWFAVEEASIYSVLRTLTRNGYAVEQAVERADTRRPRVRYALTPAGRAYYADLLRSALAQPAGVASVVDVALAAGGDLDEAEVSELLDRRAGALTELRDELDRQARSAPDAGIVDRRRALVDAELTWLGSRRQ
jgi:DNA-binding PadR family transcriptional regulator